MRSGRTIAVQHVRGALAGVVRRGRDPVPLLVRAGIQPALLGDPRARLAPERYVRLIRAVWDELDDEYLGLAEAVSPRGTFAMMCHAVAGCPDLGRLLRRAGAFYRLFPGLPGMRLVVPEPAGRHGLARFEVAVEPTADPDRFLAESLLVIWHRFANWTVDRRIRLERVEFAFEAPAHSAEYEPMFGCPLLFQRPVNALVFSTSYLALPPMRDSAAVSAFLRDSPADLLARRDYSVRASEQVRRILAQGLRGSLPSPAEVAARLNRSEQTLRRQLREEGTSFSDIRDELRRDTAIRTLAGDGERAESVEALAARLGFSEASAFHRAFRRWTGATPGAYRSAGNRPGTG